MNPNILAELKQRINKVMELLRNDLGTIRTGRATPSLVENIVINAYGGSAHLKVLELATVGTTDSQTLVLIHLIIRLFMRLKKEFKRLMSGLVPLLMARL